MRIIYLQRRGGTASQGAKLTTGTCFIVEKRQTRKKPLQSCLTREETFFAFYLLNRRKLLRTEYLCHDAGLICLHTLIYKAPLTDPDNVQ